MGWYFVYSNTILSFLVQIVFDKNNTDCFNPTSCSQTSSASTFQNLFTRIIEYCQDLVTARGSFKTTVFRLMIQNVFDERNNKWMVGLHSWTKLRQGVRILRRCCGPVFEINAVREKVLQNNLQRSDQTQAAKSSKNEQFFHNEAEKYHHFVLTYSKEDVSCLNLKSLKRTWRRDSQSKLLYASSQLTIFSSELALGSE